MWEGIDGICFKDIDGFLASMKPDDDEVDIRIHCRGGDCVEGWAIYDKLRQSGKTISCTVEGECSSMATIILLAAPAERRHATIPPPHGPTSVATTASLPMPLTQVSRSSAYRSSSFATSRRKSSRCMWNAQAQMKPNSRSLWIRTSSSTPTVPLNSALFRRCLHPSPQSV